jgi:predicted anti-sigma-YlaC factor YlaD
MNCRQLKEALRLKLGAMELGESEKRHLEECPACADYYRELLALEKPLKDLPTPAMTMAESVLLNEKLDTAIKYHKSGRVWTYRLAAGLGAVAVILLLVMSFWNRYSMPVTTAQISASGTGYVIATDSTIDNIVASIDSSQFAMLADEENETVDSTYYNMAIESYVERVGSGAGEMLLGDISDEELDYLENQIDWSDIL